MPEAKHDQFSSPEPGSDSAQAQDQLNGGLSPIPPELEADFDRLVDDQALNPIQARRELGLLPVRATTEKGFSDGVPAPQPQTPKRKSSPQPWPRHTRFDKGWRARLIGDEAPEHERPPRP